MAFSRKRNGLLNLPPQLMRDTEDRHVSVLSQNEDIERPLHEAVMLRPGLPWRTQDFEDDISVGYLQR